MRVVPQLVGKLLQFRHFAAEINEFHHFILQEGCIFKVVKLQIFNKVLMDVFRNGNTLCIEDVISDLFMILLKI